MNIKKIIINAVLIKKGIKQICLFLNNKTENLCFIVNGMKDLNNHKELQKIYYLSFKKKSN
jgi:hypothetical protein